MLSRVIRRTAAAIAGLLLIAAPAAAQVTGDISNATTKLTDIGAITRSVVGRLSDATQATDFCSGGELTGSSDATSCLQNAATALCNRARGSGQLYIPAGRYLVGGTVTFPCSGMEISGAGVGDRDQAGASGTTILAPDSGGTLPVFKAEVTRYSGQPSTTGSFAYGFHLHDLSIVNNGASGRKGAFIEIDRFQQASVDHVYFYAPCTAVKISGGFSVHVTHFIAENYSPNCSIMLVTGTTGTGTTDEVSFSEGKINAGGNNDSCFEIVDRVQSVTWLHTQCETQDHALKSSCPTMTSALYCPGFFTLTDFEAEAFPTGGNTDIGNLIDLTDTVDGFKMSDSWMRGSWAGHTVNNLLSILPGRFPFNANCRDYSTCAGNLMVNVTSSWFKFAGGDCLRINSTQVHIMGNQIYGCNNYNVGGAGITLFSPRANVIGNQFCGGDWLNDVTWQMYAADIQPGVDYLAWTGNVYNTNTNPTGQPTLGSNSCVASPVANVSTGQHMTFANNVGP